MDLSELAMHAGQAVVDAVASDMWGKVRDRVVQVFQRHAPERAQGAADQLDQTRVLIADGGDTGRIRAAALWQGRFEALLADHPGAALDLESLVRDLNLERSIATRQSINVENSPISVRRGSVTFKQTGVDNSQTNNTTNNFVRFAKGNKALAFVAILVVVAVAVALGLLVFGPDGEPSEPTTASAEGAAEMLVDAINARDAGAVQAVSCDLPVIELNLMDADARAEITSQPEVVSEFTVIRFQIYRDVAGVRNVVRDDEIHLRKVGNNWCVNDL